MTAEEFIREKIRLKNKFPHGYKMLSLQNYIVNGEEVLIWAHEFSEIKLKEAVSLLKNLFDLQNGAPLERYRKEWEETMGAVDEFLNKWGDKKENESPTWDEYIKAIQKKIEKK